MDPQCLLATVSNVVYAWRFVMMVMVRIKHMSNIDLVLTGFQEQKLNLHEASKCALSVLLDSYGNPY